MHETNIKMLLTMTIKKGNDCMMVGGERMMSEALPPNHMESPTHREGVHHNCIKI